MRTPTKRDFPQLRGKSAAYYVAWLSTGLRKYLFERRGRYAFPFVLTFIEQNGALSEDLAQIARVLGSGDLTKFQTACVTMFEVLDLLDKHDLAIAETLLSLCVKIEARGIIPVLGEKLGTTATDTGGRKPIHYLASEVIRDLAIV